MLDHSISVEDLFPKISLQQWESTVGDSLNSLIFKSIEGININPLETESVQVLELNTFPKQLQVQTFEINTDIAVVDATLIHNAGGSIIQELVYILNSVYRKIEMDNITKLEVHIALDSLYFSNIAKLRALRFMLERFSDETKTQENISFKINAHNSLREQTIFDPWVNMLRSTASSMAAIIGGADSISSFSYDHLYCQLSGGLKSSPLGKRNAENELKILIQESHMDRVLDSAKGSYAIDNITYQIVKKTWEEFQNTFESFNIDIFSKEVAKVSKKRYELVRKRKITVTGVNNFANPDETLATIYKNETSTLNFKTNGDELFPLRTIAKEFELLRSKLENLEVRIQIILFGNEAKLAARSVFCRNYFEILGIEVLETKASSDISELSSEFKRSKCENIIICAVDSDYEQNLSELLTSFVDAGAKNIYLAGKHGELLEKHSASKELKSSIYQGQNIYHVLNNFVQEVI